MFTKYIHHRSKKSGIEIELVGNANLNKTEIEFRKPESNGAIALQVKMGGK